MKHDAGAADGTALAGISTLLSIIRRSRTRRILAIFAAVMVALVLANAYGQLWLNAWHRAFYNAIERRDLPVFFEQLGVFVIIVSILLVLGVAQTWTQAVLKIRMREAVTNDVLGEWLRPKRAYRMPLVGEIGTNPDQRIQDDARSLTDLSTDFCVGLFQASILLVSFAGVLWVLSDQVIFSFHGSTFTIPGYMLWCAVLYALIGSWATWKVGKPLIELSARMRAVEADFRFTLVRANESSEGIALYRGEADEHYIIDNKMSAVFANMFRLARASARLMWVTASYGWMAIVVPIIVTAPGYFAGTLTFGDLMMVVGAFNQVQTSLRWYVDNYPTIATWHAMSGRVLTYRNVLRRLETLGAEYGFIKLTEHPTGKLSTQPDFAVLSPSGHISIEEPDFLVTPGEHILISGVQGSGKSTFFRALAGLWPWGKGEAALPPRNEMMFLPHLPYIPLGKLRDVLTYPAHGRFTDDEVRAALDRLQLGHRARYLDRVARWDKELSLDEQQRIAFVRVLLHAPKWVIEDEAMSALDTDIRHVVQSIFEKELVGTAVISIGRDEFRNHFFQRLYHLRATPPGLSLPIQWERKNEPKQDEPQQPQTEPAS